MYVLLVVLISNFSTSERTNFHGNGHYIHKQESFATFQLEYGSKEKCLNALKEMQKPSKYMTPSYLKCLPK